MNNRVFFYLSEPFSSMITVSWRDSEDSVHELETKALSMEASNSVEIINEDSPDVVKKVLGYLKEGLEAAGWPSYSQYTARGLHPTAEYKPERVYDYETRTYGPSVGTEASFIKYGRQIDVPLYSAEISELKRCVASRIRELKAIIEKESTEMSKCNEGDKSWLAHKQAYDALTNKLKEIEELGEFIGGAFYCAC